MEGNIERVLDFSSKRRSSYTEGEFWTFWALIFSPEKKETERGGSILREEKFTSRSEGTASRILEVFLLGDLLAAKERSREGRIDLERGEVYI